MGTTTLEALKRPTENDDGFTMVEILVVIIVIGILAAVAIPIYLNQRKAAHDSALEQDLRNTAMAVTTYFGSHSVDDYHAAVGGPDAVWEGPDYNYPNAGTPRWNKVFPEYQAPLSSGTFLHLQVHKAKRGHWQVHEEGEICIAGQSMNGTYQYPGGNTKLYNQMLYYDSLAGGIRTMEELVEAEKSSSGIACSGWVGTYREATGK